MTGNPITADGAASIINALNQHCCLAQCELDDGHGNVLKVECSFLKKETCAEQLVRIVKPLALNHLVSLDLSMCELNDEDILPLAATIKVCFSRLFYLLVFIWHLCAFPAL